MLMETRSMSKASKGALGFHSNGEKFRVFCDRAADKESTQIFGSVFFLIKILWPLKRFNEGTVREHWVL